MAKSASFSYLSSSLPLVLVAAALFFTAFQCKNDEDKKKDTTGTNTEPTPTTDPSVPSSKEAIKFAQDFVLTQEIATPDYNEFVASPHPLGSERQFQLATYLETRLQELGLTVALQEFNATVPNPAASNGASGPVAETLEKVGKNIVVYNSIKPDAGCVVLAGSHYDSKYFEEFRYVGANDSGSSSVLLIHLMQYLLKIRDNAELTCDVAAIWFDGEEAYLLNWTDGERIHPAKIQDNTYGSRHFVDQLTKCSYEGATAWCLPENLGAKPIVALVLLDMLGMPDLNVSRDSFSTDALVTLMANGFAELGAANILTKNERPISDDHIPFLRKKISAVDMIDFNNLDYWHREGDELDKISFESIELAGKVSTYLLLNISQNPKVFITPAD